LIRRSPSHERRGSSHTFFHLPNPKTCLVLDPQSTPSRYLMINLTLADYQGDERKLAESMRYLTWFLPRTYALTPMHPAWAVPTSFRWHGAERRVRQRTGRGAAGPR
jgi:hypothetical protein